MAGLGEHPEKRLKGELFDIFAGSFNTQEDGLSKDHVFDVLINVAIWLGTKPKEDEDGMEKGIWRREGRSGREWRRRGCGLNIPQITADGIQDLVHGTMTEFQKFVEAIGAIREEAEEGISKMPFLVDFVRAVARVFTLIQFYETDKGKFLSDVLSTLRWFEANPVLCGMSGHRSEFLNVFFYNARPARFLERSDEDGYWSFMLTNMNCSLTDKFDLLMYMDDPFDLFDFDSALHLFHRAFMDIKHRIGDGDDDGDGKLLDFKWVLALSKRFLESPHCDWESIAMITFAANRAKDGLDGCDGELNGALADMILERMKLEGGPLMAKIRKEPHKCAVDINNIRDMVRIHELAFAGHMDDQAEKWFMGLGFENYSPRYVCDNDMLVLLLFMTNNRLIDARRFCDYMGFYKEGAKLKCMNFFAVYTTTANLFFSKFTPSDIEIEKRRFEKWNAGYTLENIQSEPELDGHYGIFYYNNSPWKGNFDMEMLRRIPSDFEDLRRDALDTKINIQPMKAGPKIWIKLGQVYSILSFYDSVMLVLPGAGAGTPPVARDTVRFWRIVMRLPAELKMLVFGVLYGQPHYMPSEILCNRVYRLFTL